MAKVLYTSCKTQPNIAFLKLDLSTLSGEEIEGACRKVKSPTKSTSKKRGKAAQSAKLTTNTKMNSYGKDDLMEKVGGKKIKQPHTSKRPQKTNYMSLPPYRKSNSQE